MKSRIASWLHLFLIFSLSLGVLLTSGVSRARAFTASGFSTEARVNYATDHNWSEPSIAWNPASPGNLLAVYFTNDLSGDGTCTIYKSANGGYVWSFSATTNSNLWTCNDPVVRYRSDGIAFLTFLSDNGYVSNVYIQASRDSGATWLTPVRVDHTAYSDKESLDKPWLAIDSVNDVIYVSYTMLDKINGQQNYKIELARSTDDAGNWSKVDVTGYDTNWLVGSNVVVAPNGDVLVAWLHSHGPTPDLGQMDIEIRRSVDHGQTFSDPVSIVTANQTPYQLCGFTWRFEGTMFPRLASGPNLSGGYNVYMVYGARPAPLPPGSCTPNSGTDDGDIYFVMSSNGGTTWSTPVDLTPGGGTGNNNPDKFMPSIAVDGDSILHVTYADMSIPQTCPCGRYQIMQRQSADYGSSWQSPVAVSTQASDSSTIDFIGDYFDMAAAGHRVYAIWTDLRNNRGDIYTAVSYTVPSPPQYLKLVSATISSVQISWSPPDVIGAPPTASYNIYRGTFPGQETLYVAGYGSTSYTDSQVTSGTIYYYYLIAHSALDLDGVHSYFSTMSNELAVYVPTPSSPSPCTASASPTIGSRVLKVTFSVSCPSGVSDATWNFNDYSNPGATGTGQTTTYTYVYSLLGIGSEHFYPTVVVIDGNHVSSYPTVPTITVYCRTACPTTPSP